MTSYMKPEVDFFNFFFYESVIICEAFKPAKCIIYREKNKNNKYTLQWVNFLNSVICRWRCSRKRQN